MNVSRTIERARLGINIAVWTALLTLSIIVLIITAWIVNTYGRPDDNFNIGMNIYSGLVLIIFIGKIILVLYDFYKTPKAVK